jgi:hypothetical protein
MSADRTVPRASKSSSRPPMSMPIDAMPDYAEIGVDRLAVNLGSQQPERVDRRMAELETLVKTAT